MAEESLEDAIGGEDDVRGCSETREERRGGCGVGPLELGGEELGTSATDRATLEDRATLKRLRGLAVERVAPGGDVVLAQSLEGGSVRERGDATAAPRGDEA